MLVAPEAGRPIAELEVRWMNPLISVLACPRFVAKKPEVTKQAVAAQDFLRAMPFIPAQEAGQGITWLELYALYRLTGGPALFRGSARHAQARPQLR